MSDELPIRHRDAGREHIEVGRDSEEGTEKPQMPRHARFVKEGGDRAGRDDVGWGRSHRDYRWVVLLTNASRLPSGDQDGTLIVP